MHKRRQVRLKMKVGNEFMNLFTIHTQICIAFAINIEIMAILWKYNMRIVYILIALTKFPFICNSHENPVQSFLRLAPPSDQQITEWQECSSTYKLPRLPPARSDIHHPEKLWIVFTYDIGISFFLHLMESHDYDSRPVEYTAVRPSWS